MINSRFIAAFYILICIFLHTCHHRAARVTRRSPRVCLCTLVMKIAFCAVAHAEVNNRARGAQGGGANIRRQFDHHSTRITRADLRPEIERLFQMYSPPRARYVTRRGAWRAPVTSPRAAPFDTLPRKGLRERDRTSYRHSLTHLMPGQQLLFYHHPFFLEDSLFKRQGNWSKNSMALWKGSRLME